MDQQIRRQAAGSCRSMEDVATDQQTGGLAVSLIIDRITASRLGIATSTIDNTLYDAFGQRQINTMYTQLNQYHVILETQPQFQLDPDKLDNLYIQANASAGATGAGAATRSPGTVPPPPDRTRSPAARSTLRPRARSAPPQNALTRASANSARCNRAEPPAPRLATRFRSALSRILKPRPSRSPSIIRDSSRPSPFPSISRHDAALGTAIDRYHQSAARHEHARQPAGDFQGTAASFHQFALRTCRC